MSEPQGPDDTGGPEPGEGDRDEVRRLLQGLPDVAPPDGFYDGLMQFMRHLHGEGFVRDSHLALMNVQADPVALIHRLRAGR